ncbi:MAG: SUMF1/EgtB/PvdO family nonheme iron enzyme [Chloroflexi bacterium]|nr:SUMF1/EgtB/PvdO family nonheme iron enzyme [Chloroflexota bacterium]
MLKRLIVLMALVMVVITVLAPAPVPVQAVRPPVQANMVYVPDGYFRMGTTMPEYNEALRLCDQAGVSNCSQYFNDELPDRLVYTDAFYIDVYETTNAEYAQCVAAGVCRTPREFSAYSYPSYYGNPLYDNYPVVHVSWYDAQTYCQWRGARLLTEAEWEKAARWNPVNGDVTVWPWGDHIDSGSRLNLCDELCAFSGRYPVRDGYTDIAPVGSYPSGASPVGAYDMSGNVWEWVADFYDEGYYSYGSSTNPLGPYSAQEVVRRGGSFNNPAPFTRSANRAGDDPNTQEHRIGIRCGSSVSAVPYATLTIGGQALVNVIDDTLALRSSPGVGYYRLEDLPAGTVVTLLDGPRYADGYTWWQVRAPSGNIGWCVESADGVQTLMPIAR